MKESSVIVFCVIVFCVIALCEIVLCETVFCETVFCERVFCERVFCVIVLCDIRRTLRVHAVLNRYLKGFANTGGPLFVFRQYVRSDVSHQCQSQWQAAMAIGSVQAMSFGIPCDPRSHFAYIEAGSKTDIAISANGSCS